MKLEDMDLNELIDRLDQAGASPYQLDKLRSFDGDIARALDRTNAPYWCYWYARFVIDGRWPEAEHVITRGPEWAYYYAIYVIKGRWKEAEPVFMKDPEWAYWYAEEIIEARWPEAEKYIKEDSYYWERYSQHFKIQEK